MKFDVVGPESPWWDRAVSRYPWPDIHFQKEYVAADAGPHRYPLLAFLMTDRGVAFQPFVLHADSISSDLFNPTGFGGVYVHDYEQPSGLEHEFEQRLAEWRTKAGIATEVCVPHPRFGALPAGNIVEIGEKQIVMVDLRSDFAAQYRKSRMQSIVAAKEAGVEIDFPPLPSRSEIDSFVRLYAETMDRVSAGRRWRLSPEQLERYCCLPFAMMVNARIRGDLEVSALFLGVGSTLYYQFCGGARRDPNASSLLIHEVCCRVQRRLWFSWLNLGGGATSDPKDGVFLFKKGFGGALLTVRPHFRIHNKTRYESACLLHGGLAPSGFKPEYRWAA